MWYNLHKCTKYYFYKHKACIIFLNVWSNWNASIIYCFYPTKGCEKMIEFKNVSKTFSDGTQAVHDVSFKVYRGELLTLIGPSGCGKTTTIKMINLLI